MSAAAATRVVSLDYFDLANAAADLTRDIQEAYGPDGTALTVHSLVDMAVSEVAQTRRMLRDRGHL
jgi:hypothetical protein